MFDEFAEPMTTTASDSDAIALRAACRLVVAKHRSLRFGIHRSGKRRRAASIRPRHSSWLNVVWARSATGASPDPRSSIASRSSSRSSSRTDSGATAMVPTASSCPAWPM